MTARWPDRLRNNALTVEDLISELQQLPEDAYVVFESDYGDYTHTRQALFVEHIDELDPAEAELYDNEGYSRSRVAIRDLDEDDVDALADAAPEVLAEIEARPKVVVLS